MYHNKSVYMNIVQETTCVVMSLDIGVSRCGMNNVFCQFTFNVFVFVNCFCQI